jgi:uncharacterized protein YecT (DUF1311 family)
MSKYLLALFLYATSYCAVAQDACEKAHTTPEINACARKELDLADVALNSMYQSVLTQLTQASKDEPESGEAKLQLIAAQREWVRFREHDCQAIFTLWRTGTIRTLQYLTCMQMHAEQRTKQLHNYVPGSEP